MSLINYGVRIKDTVQAGKCVEKLDFSLEYNTRSWPATSAVPNLDDILGVVTIPGAALANRIGNHFDGEVAVYDFGHGHIGVCLEDAREHHYFIPVKQVVPDAFDAADVDDGAPF